MRLLTFRIVGCLLSLLVLFNSRVYGQDAKEIFARMLVACDNVKTATYTLSKNERLKPGNYIESEIIVKLQSDPFRVYAYSIHPNPGAQALYVPGENNNKVLVKPNKFPYVNLNVSPDNFILREHEHHSMRELGFGYISTMLKNNLKKDEKLFYSHLSFDGEVEWNKKTYFQLSITNNDFAAVTYKVLPGEDIVAIARKTDVSEYMILCMNNGLNEYDDVKPGQKILVPNSYAKKIILLLDKTSYLPLVQIIYDDKGLFEKYACQSFVLDPVIKPQEFSSKYKEYGF